MFMVAFVVQDVKDMIKEVIKVRKLTIYYLHYDNQLAESEYVSL